MKPTDAELIRAAFKARTKQPLYREILKLHFASPPVH